MKFGGHPIIASTRLADATRAAPNRTILLALLAIGILATIGVVLGVFAVVRTRRNRHFAQLALCDDLTGVGNRRRLERDLAIEAANGDTPVAVIMVDVDHFKRINDEHGHGAGDQALRAVADVLRREVRVGDVVYRYGGEEFCVLLAQTTTTEAAQVAERIRFSVSRIALAVDEPVTVSIGVALGKGAHVDQTMLRADEALFKSKDAGRDRVTLAAQPLLGPMAVSLSADPARGATFG
ncbi:MAG TPA: GGDEF domain-containing protein [Ilumatobacteraceae bacterium]